MRFPCATRLVILCKTKAKAERTLKQVEEILAGLKLHLNKTKTKIVNANKQSFEFLGFKLKMRSGKLLVTPRKKSLKKFKESIRVSTRRKQSITPGDMVGILNSTIRGWGNYFKIGDVKELFKKLDKWIRTRVRSFIEQKISRYSRIRIPNHVLKSEYKLTSLDTLMKPHSL